MQMLEVLKSILFGIVEGITEWLPISSTGHMILLDEFVKMSVRPAFMEMFLVVIQLGAILAVVVLYWNRLFPFSFKKGTPLMKKDVWMMWAKVLVGCIPAAVIGLLFDDKIDQYFYNYITVAIMLILFGIWFIVAENRNKHKIPKMETIDDLTFQAALIIGVFQLIAAVFPGTSRSGATILGALLIGVTRTAAAEFTFFLAVPTMFGASLLKMVKGGFAYTSTEIGLLLIGMVTAFIVSIIAIKFLMGYIKKHDFKAFGWYRIVLGILVLGYFVCKNFIF